MAELYDNTPELAADQARILRRRKIAQMMQERALDPIKQQQAGGYVVPTHPLEAIAKVMQGYLGRKDESASDADQKALGSDYAAKKDAAINQFKTDYNPVPATPEQPFVPDMMPDEQSPFGGLVGQEAVAARERTPQEKRQAVISAMTSPYKELEATGRAYAGFDQQDATQALARQQAKDILAQRAIDKAESDKRHKETVLALGGQRNAGNLALQDKKNEEKVSAEATKIGDKQKTKEGAKAGFAGSLDSLEAAYKELDNLGGIVNPDKSGISNLGAGLSSSAFGQAVGGAFGTKEQSLRKQISGTIPLLVLDIKNLTGASAQQMNSNVELQNFMKAASDPKSDIKSNLILLKNLRDKYLGKDEQNMPSYNDYDSIPSGTKFTDPDGKIRIKP